MLSFPLHADPSLVLSGGKGDSAERYGLGVGWQYDWRSFAGGRLDVGLDVDGSRWQLGSDNLTQLSVVPSLVYEGSQRGLKPLAYAGVGPAWINRSRLGSRELSSRLQFNSRAGLGVAMGRHSLALEAWHLSNGGLKKPNDGLTSYGLSYRYRFD
ncbi:acyloxyacyl hydrolase [Oceanimonas sp. CHS3-5]|uniref:acyloxyacyl hydrolase n=1 Tax=Oceanimonas sp. CHS3-5 TaxID=3068186 RepID=UPI00273E090C|nr:acyloxyacyl hydrolase [Oceanimonas sp. CHS3-5]MDP5291691.1 acyloxyacyl hydrolase [Oceanimonas sp. CHS3-5]